MSVTLPNMEPVEISRDKTGLTRVLMRPVGAKVGHTNSISLEKAKGLLSDIREYLSAEDLQDNERQKLRDLEERFAAVLEPRQHAARYHNKDRAKTRH